MWLTKISHSANWILSYVSVSDVMIYQRFSKLTVFIRHFAYI